MRCLVVDIGNTSTSLALAFGGRMQHVKRLEGHPSNRESIRRELRFVRGKADVQGAVVASVVPSATRTWCSCLKRETGTGPLVVNHRVRLGVKIDYPKPATIGADRLANATGAAVRYGSPIIVADFGTALTFDVVRHDDVYVGGVIAPGLPLMTDYLAENTALLPHIRPTGRCGGVGRSTVGAMRIGAHFGYRGIVREIVTHLRISLGEDFALCATGGYAAWALKGLDLPFEIDPYLTLFGLYRIFELNSDA